MPLIFFKNLTICNFSIVMKNMVTKRKIYNQENISNIMKKEGRIRKTVENLRHKMDISELLRAENPNLRIPRTFGQKASDNLTKWAGSWFFIIGFLIFLGLWIFTNVYLLIQYKVSEVFDPYPFILLNLVLSMLAAIQAPIILMSQNRQGHKDRFKAEIDYRINKKAESEIRDIKKQLNKIEELLARRKKNN